MKLGFTGTRIGMTALQQDAFDKLIRHLKPSEFRHGSCRGADVQAARIVDERRESDGWKCVIHCHPPSDRKDAESSGVDDVKHPPKTYFARNRDIVDLTDALVVCPKEYGEKDHGGTWHAYRHAVAKMKRRYMIWPDGIVQEQME